MIRKGKKILYYVEKNKGTVFNQKKQQTGHRLGKKHKELVLKYNI